MVAKTTIQLDKELRDLKEVVRLMLVDVTRMGVISMSTADECLEKI